MNWLKVSGYYLAFVLVVGVESIFYDLIIGVPGSFKVLIIAVSILAIPAGMRVKLSYDQKEK